MTAGQRTLIVIRHAKSAWPPGVPDQERPLNGRGQRDAPAVGRWLVEHDLVPELVHVSPARRTLATWGLIRSELPGDITVSTADEVYAASWETMLRVVRGSDDAYSRVALVGHNPGCEDLVAALAGPQSDPELMAQVAVKYPTAGTAVLRFDCSWADMAEAGCALVEFATPRG